MSRFRDMGPHFIPLATGQSQLLLLRHCRIQIPGKVALPKPYPRIGIIRYPHPDTVHSRRRIRAAFRVWLKAQQIVVVDVVGELQQPLVESLLRREVDVLAARERGQLARRILLHRIDRHHHQPDRSAAAAVAQVVQDLRLSRRKRHRIDHRVRPPQLRDHLRGFDLAAVVARLANQKDGVAIVVLPRLQHLRRISHGVERRRLGVVAGLKLRERRSQRVGASGKVPQNFRFLPVAHNGDLTRSAAGDAVDHGAQTVQLGVLHHRGPAALDDDHQREPEDIGVLIHMNLLGDPVVLHHELLRLQRVDHLAVFGLHRRRHQHDVGLRLQRVSLRRSIAAIGSNQENQKQRRNQGAAHGVSVAESKPPPTSGIIAHGC